MYIYIYIYIYIYKYTFLDIDNYKQKVLYIVLYECLQVWLK